MDLHFDLICYYFILFSLIEYLLSLVPNPSSSPYYHSTIYLDSSVLSPYYLSFNLLNLLEAVCMSVVCCVLYRHLCPLV